jgi:dTDP-4-dehydrorhamnose reductase
MKEKGVVFGAGFLGTRIGNELGYKISRINPIAEREKLISFLDSERPSVVVNAIGKTGGPGAIGIDWCASHQAESIESNVIVPAILAIECERRGIYFVHLGSGCVYDGDNDGKGWTEKDEPNFYGPQFYAITKINAERNLSSLPGLILRLRMPIDDRPHDRNLINKLRGYKKVINLPNSMTTVPHMIEGMKILIEQRAEGIYNFANPGRTSAAGIMDMYREIVDPNHEFEILSHKELDEITRDRRSNCYLNTEKLQLAGVNLPEIHDGVEECLESYKLWNEK